EIAAARRHQPALRAEQRPLIVQRCWVLVPAAVRVVVVGARRTPQVLSGAVGEVLVVVVRRRRVPVQAYPTVTESAHVIELRTPARRSRRCADDRVLREIPEQQSFLWLGVDR